MIKHALVSNLTRNSLLPAVNAFTHQHWTYFWIDSNSVSSIYAYFQFHVIAFDSMCSVWTVPMLLISIVSTRESILDWCTTSLHSYALSTLCNTVCNSFIHMVLQFLQFVIFDADTQARKSFDFSKQWTVHVSLYTK